MTRKPKTFQHLTGYDREKARSLATAREKSRIGRNIGEIPPVKHPKLKKKAERDFRYFCERYFPQMFHLPWSPDHLKVIVKIERAVLEGGLFAMAMPRGSGKTSLCETACLWALLYGHRKFVVLIAADERLAEQALISIKSELENNDLLLDDFPEAVFPVRSLDGVPQRAGTQTYGPNDERTHIIWKDTRIVLAMIPSSRSSGGVIRIAGITGRIHGIKHKRPDGHAVRPSLVLIDDPQTGESARSPSQCATRERILAGAILGLAGPGQTIAGLMTTTVMYSDDMADRLLDRDKHPQWQGERTKMVYSFPANESLWMKYAEIRVEGLKCDQGIAAATEFYQKHRAAMDGGAVIAWPERYNSNELSAIQHAMNLRLQDEVAFWSEYQNEPLPEEEVGTDLQTADEIAAKLNGMKRGEVSIDCTHLTAFIDVHEKALYWLVTAWEDSFTGYGIDYGTEPDQKLAYFALADVKRTLGRAAPRAGFEGSIYAGLERLTERILGKGWRRDDGALMRIGRCLIDAHWGQSTDIVYQFCRQSKYAGIVMPSHGRGYSASSIPIGDRKRKRGDRTGLNWRIPTVRGKRSVRHILVDTNYWKSFVHARLAVPMGDLGCLSFFGRKAEQHRLLADHLVAEYPVKTEVKDRGRTVDEWKQRAHHPDNHWLDCLVGAAVAASEQGAWLTGMGAAPVKQRREQISLAALQRAR